MAGLVQVRLKWSTRCRSPSPAEVVRSCSKELGKSTASEMNLSRRQSDRYSIAHRLQYYSHRQLLDNLPEAIVVIYIRQLAKVPGAERRRRARSMGSL